MAIGLIWFRGMAARAHQEWEVGDRFMPYDVLILYKDGSSKVFAEVRQK